MRTGRYLAAWGVHLYTASGAVVALVALDAISRQSYRTAFGWMIVAFLLDCTDGTLARRVGVKQVLPFFDGAKLDDIVDYVNYVIVPVALALRAGLVPGGAAGVLVSALPLLASGYGFCHAEAKTADHFFTGFPSYWNVVVLYLYALRTPPSFNVATLTLLSFLVFVPIRYLYPSRATTARRATYVLGAVWGSLVLCLLLQLPHASRALAIASLFFPVYYVGMSLHLHFNRRRAGAGESEGVR
jgi:phosphatidylcholine synthase